MLRWFSILLLITFAIKTILSADFLKKITTGVRILSANNKEEVNANKVVIEEEQEFNTKAFFIKNYTAYSLKNLQRVEEDYFLEGNNRVLYYNFGQDTITKCNDKLSNSTMILKNKTANTWTKLAGSINGTKTSKNIWEVLNQGNETGIRIKLAEGDKCISNPKVNYAITIELTCNEAFMPKKTTLDFSPLLKENKCSYLFKGESKEACPQSYRYMLQSLMHQYRFLVLIVLIVFGLLIALLGSQFKNTSILIISVIFVTAVLFTIFTRFYPIDSMKTAYIGLGACAIGGVAAGFLFISLIKTFLVVIAVFGGYTLGNKVSAKYAFYYDWQEDVIHWVIIVVFIIIIGLLVYYLYEKAIIIFTAVSGGYLVINGLELAFGGIVDIAMLRDLKKFHETGALNSMVSQIQPWISYAYLAIWIVITLIGLINQFRSKGKKEPKDDEDKKVPLTKE